MALATAARFARRELRGGLKGFRIFLACLALGVAVIFGVLNAVVKPILQVLSLPFIVLTLGLFLIVVNAIMLALTSWLSGVLGLDFHVQSFFWDAVLGSLIISAVGVVTGMMLPDGDERRAVR